ncbi:MAG: DUF2185 domain-containing protein [Alphaproteobacteria bacterium]|nr:DUF2185 domain-containing protein [Alphaproteobacteria bacterium]
MADAYDLVDPRPAASAAPYTFFPPTLERLQAIGVGDLVKLMFRANPPSEKWDCERMWVLVTAVEADALEGDLDSSPSDMPGLECGARVKFRRELAIDVIFGDVVKEKGLPKDSRREFWERCLVDRCVLDEGVQVHYVYREEPDMGNDGDKHPDSGWRIRGDMRNCSEEELDARKVQYVAIGAVLNRDDSWLHLIDEPIRSAFDRDFETGVYVRCVN